MATNSKPTAKSAKKSRIIILRLSPENLSQFPSDVSDIEVPEISIKPDPSPSIQITEDNPEESNSTPVPVAGGDGNTLAPPDGDGKKKKGGSAAGRKRAPPSIDPFALPKERSKPGPKKKPKLAQDKGIMLNGAAANAVSKLGPKAHMGPINAGLRALDRSGKPCRRWERKGLVLKSFTGTTWGMNTWKAPPRDNGFSGDVKSDSAGSSEVKPTQESSVVASERSQGAAEPQDVTMNGMESSPAPIAA